MAHGNDRYTRCEEEIEKLHHKVKELECELDRTKRTVSLALLKIGDTLCINLNDYIDSL